MNKKKSITIFIILSVLIVITAVLAFVEFPIGLYDYNGYAKSIKLGLDLSGGVSAVFDVVDTDEDGNKIDKDTLRASLDGVVSSMQALLISKNYTEAVVSYDLSGDPTLTVEVPNVDDPERVFDLIGRPASLKITNGKEGTEEKVYIIGKKHLESVGLTQDPDYPSSYAVSLQFNKEGTTAFATATTENKGGQVVFFINNEKFMTVNVNTVISDGRAIIQQSNGGYSYEAAYELATRLQAGTFGVDLISREPNIVSPTLGDSAIRNSLIAGAIGMFLVLVFMFVVYRNFGLMADIALIIYVELLLVLCAVFGVQLTLPGIAGIVLGIGMAVDANIVIFERIKDEFKNNIGIAEPDFFSKPTRSADGKITSQGGIISVAFRRAAVTVIDANITTLIGAVVLWILGGQAVVGFAITLFISILVSMFTSLIVTRGLIYTLTGFDGYNNPKLYNLKKEAK